MLRNKQKFVQFEFPTRFSYIGGRTGLIADSKISNEEYWMWSSSIFSVPHEIYDEFACILYALIPVLMYCYDIFSRFFFPLPLSLNRSHSFAFCTYRFSCTSHFHLLIGFRYTFNRSGGFLIWEILLFFFGSVVYLFLLSANVIFDVSELVANINYQLKCRPKWWRMKNRIENYWISMGLSC